MKIRNILLATAAIVALTAPAQARAITQIELVNTVSIEVEVAGPDGAKAMHLSPANTVTPGDTVVYAIAYRNSGKSSVADVVINNPLAESVAYVAAGDGQEPLVSVDGNEFKPLAQLTVADEDGVRRPAAAADVRHLRWTLLGSVASGQGGQVAFRARLK